MHEILRKRVLRRLEVLPEAQLYQVLDYIEFLESKYAPGKAPEPGGLQRFAERLEDRMRARSVVPGVVSGTMKVLGTAGKVLDGIGQAGRGLVEGLDQAMTTPREGGVERSRAGPGAAGGAPPASDGSGAPVTGATTSETATAGEKKGSAAPPSPPATPTPSAETVEEIEDPVAGIDQAAPDPDRGT